MSEPLDVNVVNRGDTAATGPGLILGTIGLIFVLAGLAMLITLGLILLIPVTVIFGAGWLLVRILRLQERHEEYCRAMGFEESRW